MTLPLIIHIAQEADWMPIMKKIEKLWPEVRWGGIKRTIYPTEMDHWGKHEQHTCVDLENDRLCYGSIEFYEMECPNTPILPATEFLAEELHPSITHINASKEFLNDPESVKMINKMVRNAALVMSHYQKCPVCEGKGVTELRHVGNGEYSDTCHVCEGKCIIVSPDIVQELEKIRDDLYTTPIHVVYDRLTDLINKRKLP